MSKKAIPFAENLMGYIEQRGDELALNELSKFIYEESTWMRGYLQACKDYKVKTNDEIVKLREVLDDTISILLAKLTAKTQ